MPVYRQCSWSVRITAVLVRSIIHRIYIQRPPFVFSRSALKSEVLIQYWRVTDIHPPSQPPSHVAVSSTRYACLRRAVNKKLSWCWQTGATRLGQSRSPNIVPFYMLGILSSCAIVTLSLRRAVFLIFDFKKCHDLKQRVTGPSRSV